MNRPFLVPGIMLLVTAIYACIAVFANATAATEVGIGYIVAIVTCSVARRWVVHGRD